MKLRPVLTALAAALILVAHADPPLDELQAKAGEGDAEAQYQLGRAYARGHGVPVDMKRAFELFLAAAKQGHVKAMSSTGYLYIRGDGVEADPAAAAEWSRQAAEAGSPAGQMNYGWIVRTGHGVKASNHDGIAWIQKAADGGFSEAQYTLGLLFLLGDEQQPTPEPERALKILRPLAEAGHARAQNLLGVAYRDGLGLSAPDPEAAQEWFRKAALQGERKAQSNLGHLLGEPVASNPNREEALKWLLISEANGEITAKRTLQELSPAIDPGLLAKTRLLASQFQPESSPSPAPEPTDP